MCVAGWMAGQKVGYPIRFPSAKCGDNHVGIVLYKEPVNVSWTYDAYCYRMRGMEKCLLSWNIILYFTINCLYEWADMN